MPQFSWDFDPPTIPEVWVPPAPEVIEIPADLPTLEPSVVVTLPLSEEITSAVIVPDEHNGTDVLYVAVSQERVNVWAAVVYFVPEIALGLSVLLVLVAARKLWVGRRFVHRKGEAYCKKCWAGLTGVQSQDCPECGRAVAKTKRVAKRTHRSPLSPRWLWACVAVLVSLGTATLWFGESWQLLRQNGFDTRSYGDWLALVDPLENESVFRINKMAQWFDWRSAKLAAFARKRDHAWIDTVSEAYQEGEGVRIRLLVRRYDTTRGNLLTEDMLPADSYWQDDGSWGSTPVYLHQIAGVVLVDDIQDLYRYRHDAEPAWVKIGAYDDEHERTSASLTADGRHLIYCIREVVGDGLFPDYGDPELWVYDLDTGELVSMLRIRISNRFMDQIEPTLKHLPGTIPPTDEISFDYSSFVPLDTPGQIMLRGSSTSPTWDYLNHTLSNDDVGFLEPERAREDLHIPSYSHGLFGRSPYSRLEADVHFQQQTLSLQRSGNRWVTMDTIAPDSRQLAENNDVELPWDTYNFATDIPLYGLDHVRAADRADRLIRISWLAWVSIDNAWVSSDGRWLHISMSRDPQDGAMVGHWLRIDLQSGEAVGWYADGVRAWLLTSEFVNDGAQFIMVCDVERNPVPEHSAYDGHEIRIYDLPE